jgi:ADP-ribose pyrophosphatase YjhB (NUDIX family)
LPGGGIEAGEDINIALNREMMEEVGVNINVLGEIGTIIEYRDNYKQLQISYCFYAEVKGDIKETSFTDEEINEGFQLKWIPLEEAVSILENDIPDDYVGKFIQSRDLLFLKKAYGILKVNKSDTNLKDVEIEDFIAVEDGDLEKIWTQACEIIKNQISEVTFYTWIKTLEIKGIENNSIIVIAPNSFTADIVKMRYSELILSAIKLCDKSINRIVVINKDDCNHS